MKKTLRNETDPQRSGLVCRGRGGADGDPEKGVTQGHSPDG